MISAFKRNDDDLKYKPFMNIINVSVDYCNYLSGHGAGAFLVDLVAKEILKYGNVIQQCPLQGHIYLKNARLDISIIPFFIPLGTYAVNVYIYRKDITGNMFLADFTVYGEVRLGNQRR